LKLLAVIHQTLKVLRYRSTPLVVFPRLTDLGCPYGDFEISQRPAGIERFLEIVRPELLPAWWNFYVFTGGQEAQEVVCQAARGMGR
jgi:hypothetical protein